MRRAGICLFSLFLVASAVDAADFPYRDTTTFAGRVQSPTDFFGISLGERFTAHRDVLAYCRHVAQGSDRVLLVEYGRSAEGRELVYLVCGRPDRLRDVNAVRERQRRLADPRRIGADLANVIETQPAIVWLSYNVHGNEASATEAALQVIYQLADGTDATTQRILDHAVVVLDPLLNPDGRERYVSWYHSVAAPKGNPDPEAREHDEPWPGGRTNHYYFDLNRDWAWQSQVETQARIAHYLDWQPLVHVDFHEMSPETSYFFFPAEDPINSNLPDHTVRWGKAFGRANAEAFDRWGWRYYSAESFDLFYPGYGDTWPSFHGAIGMTYEQAGGPSAGLRYRQRSGHVLTLTERLHHHFVTSFATLECVADRKEELQRSFHEFRVSALAGAHARGVVEYAFPPITDWYRQRMLIDLLVRQGIEVDRTLADAIAAPARSFDGSQRDAVKLPAGTYLVPVAQPAGRLVQALLEPEAKVTVNRFYDVSAWSLPFAMGVDALVVESAVAVDRERVAAVSPPPVGDVAAARYAYLLPWVGVPSVRALVDLQRQGVSVHLLPDEVEIEGRRVPRGALVVFVEPQNATLHDAVRATARRFHVEFIPVASGWTEVGVDLGSSRIEMLRPVRIAVASGSGISSSAFGGIWSLFERELELPFTAFGLDALGSLELDRYDVLVFPDGNGLRSRLDERVVDRLTAWVRQGGVLIGIGGAAFALTQEGAALASISSQATKARAEADKKENEKEPERLKLKDLDERSRERQVPGNILRVDLDIEHPLTFGLPPVMHVFMDSTESFAVRGRGGDVAAFTEDPAASGYISEDNLDKLKQRVYLAEQDLGRGRVILFAGDPNFRLFWRGTTPLFLNAIFLRSYR
ncbi:MAG: M14 family metallopeptidase [Planctomycetota bacterium]